MLIENKFVFIAIPKCATMSFEDACLKNNFIIDYSPYSLFNRGMLNGIRPTTHVHIPITKLREIHGNRYPFVTLNREEVSRFISAWKHILKIIYNVDKPFYNEIKYINNDTFCFYFGKHFLNLNITNEKVVNFFSDLGYKKTFPKFLIEIFLAVFKPEREWTNNDSTIIRFSFETEIPKFEDWVSNQCGVNFKLTHINDTKDIETNLIKDDFFIDFYQTKLNPVSLHKRELSLI